MSFLWTWNNMQIDVTHNLQINNWHFRSSRPEVFYKKVVLRNFAKFIEKQLYSSLFFNKVADLRLFLQNTFGGCFWHTDNNSETVKLQHTTWKCFSLQFAGSQVTDSQIPGSCECTSCLPSCQMTEDLVN